MAALAASLLPCVGIEQAAFLRFLDGIAPGSVSSLLKDIVSNVYAHVFPALPISILVLLWSSARAFSELLNGVTAMTRPDLKTGYLKRRLRAILLTLALLATLLLSLAMLIFGARITLLLGSLYPQLAGILVHVLWIRYIVMGLFLWLLFVFLYRSIPEQPFTFREVRTGAALSALAWILFSWLFSLYAGSLMDLTLYGSLAALVLTMLWLFYCQYIVLAGAGLCAWMRAKKEAAPLGTAS